MLNNLSYEVFLFFLSLLPYDPLFLSLCVFFLLVLHFTRHVTLNQASLSSFSCSSFLLFLFLFCFSHTYNYMHLSYFSLNQSRLSLLLFLFCFSHTYKYMHRVLVFSTTTLPVLLFAALFLLLLYLPLPFSPSLSFHSSCPAFFSFSLTPHTHTIAFLFCL